jgi:hypothetical protein
MEEESEVAMTSKPIDGHTHPSKMHYPVSEPDCSYTVYVLMGICYLLIGITLYMIWQKASSG